MAKTKTARAVPAGAATEIETETVVDGVTDDEIDAANRDPAMIAAAFLTNGDDSDTIRAKLRAVILARR